MAISHINHWDNTTGTGATATLAISPATAGNILCLFYGFNGSPGGEGTISAISGGGVTTWHAVEPLTTVSGTYDVASWYGVVTTPGSSTISVTLTVGGGADLTVEEFSSNLVGTGTWGVVAHGTLYSTGSSAVIDYPSLSTNTNNTQEGYAGYAVCGAGHVSGWTPPGTGTWNVGGIPGDDNGWINGIGLSNTTYAPVDLQSPAANAAAVAMIVGITVTGTPHTVAFSTTQGQLPVT